MIVLSDNGFNAKKDNPKNLKICRKRTWNERMVIETVFSMLTIINHFKQVKHRAWLYFKMRLAYTMAMFSMLASWSGLQCDETGEFCIFRLLNSCYNSLAPLVIYLMRTRRIELPLPCENRLLRPARLPVPPRPRVNWL